MYDVQQAKHCTVSLRRRKIDSSVDMSPLEPLTVVSCRSLPKQNQHERPLVSLSSAVAPIKHVARCTALVLGLNVPKTHLRR